MQLVLSLLAEVLVSLFDGFLRNLGEQETSNSNDASVFAVIHRRENMVILFRHIFQAHELIAFAQFGVDVLLVLETVDFGTNLTILVAFWGRRRVKT